MNATAADPSAGPADRAGPASFDVGKRRWPAAIGAALTLAMIAGLVRQLFGDGLAGLSRSVPASPWFYVCFGLLYLSLPTGDYVIFRRLWGLPIAGLAALVKKRIANEVVFGYSGEAYFYAWARSRARAVAAPFGAVKDVSILSAVAGNAVTLALMLVAWPIGRTLLSAAQSRAVAVSALLVVAASLPFLLFSGRVFTLPPRTLRWIFAVHCARLAAGSTLIALAWHCALPGAPAMMWLFMAAARMLVSRLPLLPNKDLLFANVAILAIGGDRALSDVIAFTAAATLVVHVGFVVLSGAATLGRAHAARGG